MPIRHHLRTAAKILAFLPILFFFQNCSPYHQGEPLLGSDSLSAVIPSGYTLSVDQALHSQAMSILQSKCALCHQDMSNGGVTQILDLNHLLATGLVVAGDPAQGRLIGSIQDGSMPQGGSVSAAELQTLKDWVSSMHLVLIAGGGTAPAPIPGPPPSPLPAGKTARADTTLHNQAMQILNANCAACHQGVTNGGITDILVLDNLVRTGLVVPGDPTKGRLLGSMADGTMPDGNGARVTAADQQTLKNWINSITIVDDVGQAKMPTRAALSSTFTGVFANIFQPKCTACHGPVLARNLRLDSYTAIKNNASKSRQECQSGSMPDRPYPALTAAELNALNAWIAGGSLNN